MDWLAGALVVCFPIAWIGNLTLLTCCMYEMTPRSWWVVSWCFEPSQPLGIMSGPRDVTMMTMMICRVLICPRCKSLLTSPGGWWMGGGSCQKVIGSQIEWTFCFFEKRWVFRFFLEVSCESHSFRQTGRLFHKWIQPLRIHLLPSYCGISHVVFLLGLNLSIWPGCILDLRILNVYRFQAVFVRP